MPNINPGSARMEFQWKYVEMIKSDSILNVGCSDDPLGFGLLAHHFDIDDWSYLHRRFTQGNAAALPFRDEEFELVILGDILEHVREPNKVVSEAARVCSKWLVLTIWEEWRLPGPGQWITEGQQLGDETARELGFENREAHQKVLFPEKVGFDDTVEPHLIHINQFTDADIEVLLTFIEGMGFEVLEALKAFEVVHEGHDAHNWLLAFERLK